MGTGVAHALQRGFELYVNRPAIAEFEKLGARYAQAESELEKALAGTPRFRVVAPWGSGQVYLPKKTLSLPVILGAVCLVSIMFKRRKR